MVQIRGGGPIQGVLLRCADDVDMSVNPNLQVMRIGKRFPRPLRSKRGRRDQARRVSSYNREAGVFSNVCLIDALQSLGTKVPYTSNWPFWAFADGRQFLKPFGKTIRNCSWQEIQEGGRYVVNHDGHFTAFRMHDGEIVIHTGKRASDFVILWLRHSGPRYRH